MYDGVKAMMAAELGLMKKEGKAPVLRSLHGGMDG